MSSFTPESKGQILDRMLGNVSADVDKREGSVTHDMLSPASIELAGLNTMLETIFNLSFAETSAGEWLTKRANEVGVNRKTAENATGTVTFTGPASTVIPKGTRISTDEKEPRYFVTDAEVTIDSTGTVDAAVTAEVAGLEGNVDDSTVIVVLGDLSGVVTVNNANFFAGGKDAESDGSLLQRYFDKLQKPITSGNKHQYESWAKEVTGIADARVFPLWNGNGTVKVVLLDDEKTAPTSTKVTETSDHIETVRPIGASVTVVGATEVLIDVTATLTLTSTGTLTDAKTQIETALVDYLKTLAFVDPIVRYSEIGRIILDAEDVKDYSNLTVNGGTANISVTDEEVAVKGTVSLS